MKLDGGAGNDTLVTGPAGAANLLGGADADVMASSAGYCAVASYGDHDRAGVRVTLDRTANAAWQVKAMTSARAA
jgi:Ca2+-binding RTX toxin-like protein